MKKRKKIYVLVWDDGFVDGASTILCVAQRLAKHANAAASLHRITTPGKCHVYEVTKMRKVPAPTTKKRKAKKR